MPSKKETRLTASIRAAITHFHDLLSDQQTHAEQAGDAPFVQRLLGAKIAVAALHDHLAGILTEEEALDTFRLLPLRSPPPPATEELNHPSHE